MARLVEQVWNAPCTTRRDAITRGQAVCHFLANFRKDIFSYLESMEEEDDERAAAAEQQHFATRR